MKIEKRGNKYRIQPMIKGKRQSITLDYKPTQREIAQIIEELEGVVNGTSTFEKATRSMIKDKSNVLSPSTIRGYNNILNGLSREFKSITIIEMTSNDVQREVNYLATQKSPKTVSNYYGLISSVLAYFRPNMTLKVKLPPKQIKTAYCPNKSDIRILLDDCMNNGYGEKYIFPILLGCHGMRLGEVTALTDDDIDVATGMVTINKTKVYASGNEFVIKPTAKTDKSNRVIQISEQCIEAYERYGLYEGYPKSISDYMRKRQDALGLERFGFHKLRHYFASQSIDAGIPIPTIQDFGGWSTPRTLNQIYTHNLRDFAELVENLQL